VVLALTACSPGGLGHASVTPAISVGSAASPPQAASLREICQAPVLRASLGRQARTGTPQQRSVPVTLTNRGHGTCHMRGYPRVVLVEGNLDSDNAGEIRVPVPRHAATVTTVTLRPGASTSFTLTFHVEDAQRARDKLGAVRPGTIWVTPPGSGSHLTVKWRFRPVLAGTIGTGATTYVTPVGS
jgi:hypothetical protein